MTTGTLLPGCQPQRDGGVRLHRGHHDHDRVGIDSLRAVETLHRVSEPGLPEPAAGVEHPVLREQHETVGERPSSEDFQRNCGADTGVQGVGGSPNHGQV